MEHLKKLFGREGEAPVHPYFRRTLMIPEREVIPDPIAAGIGAERFAKASGDYPASIQAQGAKIALLCQDDSQYSPQELGEALLADDAQLDRVLLAANTRHKFSGNGPTDEEGNLLEVDSDRARYVIDADFRWAEVMIELTAVDLCHLLDRYTYYQGSSSQLGGRRQAMLYFVGEVEALLQRKLGFNKFTSFVHNVREAEQRYFAKIPLRDRL